MNTPSAPANAAASCAGFAISASATSQPRAAMPHLGFVAHHARQVRRRQQVARQLAADLPVIPVMHT